MRSPRVTDVVLEQDVMLHFPMFSNPVIDMLQEAAIGLAITAIRNLDTGLASNSRCRALVVEDMATAHMTW